MNYCTYLPLIKQSNLNTTPKIVIKPQEKKTREEGMYIDNMSILITYSFVGDIKLVIFRSSKGSTRSQAYTRVFMWWL